MQNENPLNYVFVDDEKPVNVREVFDKYSYHWKWFVLGIVLALTGAYLYLRYTPREYAVATTILIEDETSGGMPSELSAFQDLGLFGSPKKKVETEIGLLKSRSLMERAVKTLGLNRSYYTEGRVRETELYKTKVPLLVNVINDSLLATTQDTLVRIKVLSPTQFELRNSAGEQGTHYNFNDTITTGLGTFTVMPMGDIPLKEGEEILLKLQDLKAVARQFSNSLKVELKYKNASLIELSLNTSIKEKGKDLLNELVRQYNMDAVEDKSLIGKNTAIFINDRMRVIEEDLFSADSGVEQFKTSNKLTDITSEAALALESNSELEKKILELNTQIKLVDYVMDYLGKNANELIPDNLGLNDGAVNSSTQQYNELLLERNRILKGSKSEHPIIVNMDDQLSQLRRSISEGLKNLKSSLNISLKDAMREEQKMSSKITSVPKQEREYRDMQRQQQIIETLYLYLMQKREENAIALAVTVPNAKVIDVADGSEIPVSPKRSIVYLAGLLLGGLVPFMVLYLRFLFDNKIHSSKDVEAVVTAPIIGEIPHSKSKDNIVVNGNNRDPIAEAFRMLRTNIYFMLSHDKTETKTIFVTSTLGGEGKTFLSLNLATALALSSKKVLLIGADIRKPKFNEYLGVEITQGLTHFLVDDSIDLSKIIKHYPKANFDLLGSGIVPPNPSELLMNGRFEDVMTYARAHYEFVIVDTAPVKMVTDTLLLSTYADLSLYIIRSGVLDKRLLEIPEKIHKDKRLPNMAMVLNDINVEKVHGYGYGYGYGYGENYGKTPWWKRF